MATCNGEKFLERQLDSILGQSIPPFEIVICDDASEDGTPAVIEKFRKQAPGLIRPFSNPVRLGSSGNFGRAVAETRGEAVFLADQDDFWLPDKIREMSRILSASERAGGVFSDSAIADEALNDSGIGHWECRGFSASGLESAYRSGLLPLFLARVPAAGHDMAFHASMKSLLLPFPALAECHDTWIGLVLAALDRWCFTPEKLTLFRQHGANASQSGRRRSWIEEWREAKKSAAKNTFAWNAELYRCLLERLAGHCSPEAAGLLADRMEHSRVRAAMDCGFAGRLPSIAGELWNGRYFRYGRGWKSVVQDLLLRGGKRL